MTKQGKKCYKQGKKCHRIWQGIYRHRRSPQIQKKSDLRVSVPNIYYLLFCRCRKNISAEFRQNPKQQDSKFLCLPKSESADFEFFELDFWILNMTEENDSGNGVLATSLLLQRKVLWNMSLEKLWNSIRLYNDSVKRTDASTEHALSWFCSKPLLDDTQFLYILHRKVSDRNSIWKDISGSVNHLGNCISLHSVNLCDVRCSCSTENSQRNR